MPLNGKACTWDLILGNTSENRCNRSAREKYLQKQVKGEYELNQSVTTGSGLNKAVIENS